MKKTYGSPLFAIAFLLILSLTVSAQDYRIVLGSFLDAENAARFVETLKKAGFQTDTETAVSNGRAYTRVCLSPGYATLKEAERSLNRLRDTAFFGGLNGNDIWIRNPSLAPSGIASRGGSNGKPTPAPAAAQKLPLTAAPPVAETPLPPVAPHTPASVRSLDVPALPPVSSELSVASAAVRAAVPEIIPRKNTGIPLDDAHPVGIRTGRFGIRSDAERAAEILAESFEDSYVLETYSPENGVVFELFVGAFAESAEAGPTFERLLAAGTGFPEITSLETLKPRMDAYDALSPEDLASQPTREPFLESVPRDAMRLAANCPVPPDMRISSLVLADQRRPLAAEGFPSVPDFVSETGIEGAGWSMILDLEGLLDESTLSIRTFYAPPEAGAFFRRMKELEPAAPIVKSALDWKNRDVTGVSYGPTELFEKWYGWDEKNSQGWIIAGTSGRVRSYLGNVVSGSPAGCESFVRSLAAIPRSLSAELRSFSYLHTDRSSEGADDAAAYGVWKSSACFATPDGPLSVDVFDLNHAVSAERAVERFTAGPDGGARAGSSGFFEIDNSKAWYSAPESDTDLSRLYLVRGSLVAVLKGFPERRLDKERLTGWARLLGIR